MQGLRKSKRVSWAPEVNLCQVKLFLLEESPSLVGLVAQDHLQAKAAWPVYSPGLASDDNLPPGFEGSQPTNILQNKLSQIPVIKWQSPPRFVLDGTWAVVAGEESKEMECENQREMRVLEAVYPRPSAIPPNPFSLMSLEDSNNIDTDSNTPLIPLTPIEDDDAAAAAAADASFNHMAQNTVSMSPPAQLSASGTHVFQSSDASNQKPLDNCIPQAATALGIEPDMITAAYTALSAVMANNDQGNLIDPDLLVKILGDPKLMEKLSATHGASTNTPAVTIPDPPLANFNRTEAAPSSFAATPSRPLYPCADRVGPVSNLRQPPPVGAPPLAKDINYYKNLIQQHGGERPETQSQSDSRHHQPASNPKARDLKPKIMKPCIYFNTSRGCRHGVNCAYQHDVLSQAQQRVNGMQEVQSAKRMKFEREITGI